MTTAFPGGLDSFSTKVPSELITSAEANKSFDAIEAIEGVLVGPVFYNVKAYGAVGDGVTDDFTAIRAAVNAAAEAGGGTIYFPPGVYLVGTTAVLTPSTTTSGNGLRFVGAGWDSSIIRLNTTGYLYNNGSTARTQFATFSDLGFEGVDPAVIAAYTDIPTTSKGFRLWATTATGSHEQGFKFHCCRFTGFDTVFETDGDNTASELHFIDCKINQVRTTVMSIDNIQSFNHEFHGTDAETIYGDVFTIGADGGGAIKMFGGSVIMLAGAAASYFFKVIGATGAGAYPLTFNGVRFELRGSSTNLVSIADTKEIDAEFTSCLFEDQHTATKAAWVTIQAYAKVHFRGCTFFEPNGTPMRFVVDSDTDYGERGTITFESCGVPVDWSDRCSMASWHGMISATGCYGTNIGAVSAGAHWAHDFDTRWDEAVPGLYSGWTGTYPSGGSPTHNALRLKTAQMKLATEYWPDNTEHTLKLPLNAIIKNIHLRKPAGGSDATSTIMRVGRNDKSGTDHLVSDTQRMDVAHTGDTTNFFYHVGSTTNERTLRLFTDENPSAAIQGGLCIVEYY